MWLHCRRRPTAAAASAAGGSAAAAAAAASGGAGTVLHPRKTDIRDANFPMDAEGRTYHLGTKRGEVGAGSGLVAHGIAAATFTNTSVPETAANCSPAPLPRFDPQVANRILSVGSEKRALVLAEYLQPPAPGRGLFMLESSRGFLTITGRYLVRWRGAGQHPLVGPGDGHRAGEATGCLATEGGPKRHEDLATAAGTHLLPPRQARLLLPPPAAGHPRVNSGDAHGPCKCRLCGTGEQASDLVSAEHLESLLYSPACMLCPLLPLQASSR